MSDAELEMMEYAIGYLHRRGLLGIRVYQYNCYPPKFEDQRYEKTYRHGRRYEWERLYVDVLALLDFPDEPPHNSSQKLMKPNQRFRVEFLGGNEVKLMFTTARLRGVEKLVKFTCPDKRCQRRYNCERGLVQCIYNTKNYYRLSKNKTVTIPREQMQLDEYK